MVRVEGKHSGTTRLARGVTDVELTESGLWIVLSDASGHTVMVHRHAWQDVVDTVGLLLAGRKEAAERHAMEVADDE